MTRPDAPTVEVRRWGAGGWRDDPDSVAAEEPLQISLDGRPLSVVMRTPGADVELVLGLLLAEGVIDGLSSVEVVLASAESEATEADGVEIRRDLIESNAVDVRLRAGPRRRVERSFLSSSACGVCGATTLESLALEFAPLPPGPKFDPAVIPLLPPRLRSRQQVFDRTGGLHAAGLFDGAGAPLCVREDIGRHNAVDKVVGWAMLQGLLPLSRSLLAVSGRAGFELVQKSIAAGIPLLASVGAPSSLSVATASRFGLTLVGFVRDSGFNVYAGSARLD